MALRLPTSAFNINSSCLEFQHTAFVEEKVPCFDKEGEKHAQGCPSPQYGASGGGGIMEGGGRGVPASLRPSLLAACEVTAFQLSFCRKPKGRDPLKRYWEMKRAIKTGRKKVEGDVPQREFPPRAPPPELPH